MGSGAALCAGPPWSSVSASMAQVHLTVGKAGAAAFTFHKVKVITVHKLAALSGLVKSCLRFGLGFSLGSFLFPNQIKWCVSLYVSVFVYV